MTNPLYTIQTLPTNSQAALREFDERYIASIGAVQPSTWSDMGELIQTDAPHITFPISSLALKYLQTEGESRFKTLLDKSFDIKSEEFDAGLEAKLIDLKTKTFAYKNWLQGPARMMIAEARFRNRAIATLLESGHSTAWVPDGANFFSATHLSDLTDPSSTTWSNYQSSGKAVTIANLEAEVTLMQGALDENGEKLGVDPDTIIVPTAIYEKTKNTLAQAMILTTAGAGEAAAIDNPYKGRFNVVHVPELTDVNDWYLVDSKLLASSGLPPWIMMRYMAPGPELSLRHWDESSDFFKDTGRIKVSSHIWYGFALAFPWAIRKVTGA